MFRRLCVAMAFGACAGAFLPQTPVTGQDAKSGATPAQGKPDPAAAPEKVPELPKADAAGYISLFNGKDLTHWEGYPGYWAVKDGAIEVNETKANSKHTFLVLSQSKANPAKFANFEFQVTYKWLSKSGNSGIQFRSTFKKGSDPKNYVISGYQADIDPTTKYPGTIYGEAGGGKSSGRGVRTIIEEKGGKGTTEKLAVTGQDLVAALKPADWNQMVITAKGNYMSIAINGKLMTELIDKSANAQKDGIIALQCHSGQTMTCQFKDIKIKLLAP